MCHDVALALEPDAGGPWYSRFAWANVYPLAPDEPRDSPRGPLKEAQDPFVGGLFADLLDMLDAKRVVIVSGPAYWSHPAQAAAFASLPTAAFPLLRARRVDRRTIVVGCHPTYARRRRIGADAYAARIVETIASLERDAQ